MQRDFQQFVHAQSAIFDSIQSAAAASGFGALRNASRHQPASNPSQHRNPVSSEQRSAGASSTSNFVVHVPAASFSRTAPPPPLRQYDKKKAGGTLSREGILPVDPNARGAFGRKTSTGSSSQCSSARAAEGGKGARSSSSAAAPTTQPQASSTRHPPFTDGDPKFISMIEREIIPNNADVSWDQIAALHDAKRLLRECCVMPLLVPDLFTGLRQPWKGVLLFGPPGTGKTLLAKAVASETGTTFFNVTPASVISKYHGESEKIVTTLFAMARHYAPSVLFFDEIDALMSERGAAGEHEASRRLKTTFLSEMDGLNSRKDSRIVVIGTTNCPWDLDVALRRRLEKRIHVRLPNTDARKAAVSMFLSSLMLDADLLQQLSSAVAEASHNFSFADLHSLCKEASMAPMRRAMDQHSTAELKELQSRGELALEVCEADVKQALSKVKPTIDSEALAKFDAWAGEFGSE
jgi:AAA+ superfamily predicted ATPase